MREAASNTSGKTVRFVYGTCKFKGLKKEKAKEKTMDNPNEHGHLTPTAMKMVAESCKK